MAESVAALLPILPHSTPNPTGLSINYETYCADRTVISFQCAISSGLGILFSTQRSKIQNVNIHFDYFIRQSSSNLLKSMI